MFNVNPNSFQALALWISIILTLGFNQLDAQTVDFGETDFSEPDQRPDVTTNISDLKKTLWKGKGKALQLEVGKLHDKILWIVADNTKLHLTQGMSISPYPGTVKRRIPGRILSLGFHQVPSQPGVSMVTIFYREMNYFKSTLFLVRSTTDGFDLSEFYSVRSKAITPIDKSVYGQYVDPMRLWQKTIFRMNPTESGYKDGSAVSMPSGSRVLSLTRLGADEWIQIDSQGDLVLSNGQAVLDRIEGNFGWSRRTGIDERLSQDGQSEPIRIRPQYSIEKNVIVTVENTVSNQGLSGMFTRSTPNSRFRLFTKNRENLRSFTNLGPLEGTITDFEISDQNPNQLLWFRMYSQRQSTLEMIDLSKLTGR